MFDLKQKDKEDTCVEPGPWGVLHTTPIHRWNEVAGKIHMFTSHFPIFKWPKSTVILIMRYFEGTDSSATVSFPYNCDIIQFA